MKHSASRGNSLNRKVSNNQKYASIQLAASLPRSMHASRRYNRLQQCRAVITEPVTGVAFQDVQRTWVPDSAFRCLGSGARVKKILMIKAKVYAVALYVQAELAAREMGVRNRGGFFETGDDYCQAIMDGAFTKMLALTLVRDVEGKQFTDAMKENVEPRLKLSNAMDVLDTFNDFFLSKTLQKGTTVLLMWRPNPDAEVLDICILPPGSDESYGEAQAQLSISSSPLCRALFEVFLGQQSKLVEAKASWVEGVKKLIDADNDRRGMRKGGAG